MSPTTSRRSGSRHRKRKGGIDLLDWAEAAAIAAGADGLRHLLPNPRAREQRERERRRLLLAAAALSAAGIAVAGIRAAATRH